MMIAALIGVVKLKPLKNKSMLKTTPNKDATTIFGQSPFAILTLFFTKIAKIKNKKHAPKTRMTMNA